MISATSVYEYSVHENTSRSVELGVHSRSRPGVPVQVGGTSIEDIAEEDPSAIIKMPVDIIEGLSMEKATPELQDV